MPRGWDAVSRIRERHPCAGGSFCVERLGELRDGIATEQPGVDQVALVGAWWPAHPPAADAGPWRARRLNVLSPLLGGG